jgi:glycolate oxidase iron-sulfur subunit
MDLKQSGQRFGDNEYKRKLDQCIHCGLCLQACPTYEVLGREMDSPRGRISLIRAAAEGRIDLTAGALQSHLGLCLTCRSCETACPSGVQYGAILDVARLAIEQTRRPGYMERFIRWLALRQLMPHLPHLKAIAWFAKIYQIMGLSKLVRAVNFLPEHLKALEGSLPPMPAHYSNYKYWMLKYTC